MLPERIPGLSLRDEGPLVDPFGRVHTYLRVSVTDRCNYRCVYCMPKDGIAWTPRDHLLSYEEIARIVRVLAGMGLRRVRLTGGEPTVRRDLPDLVAKLAATPGIDEVSLTTNGHLFAAAAAPLAAAGLRRVNISIDSLEHDQFSRLTRGGDVNRVLDAIDAAIDARLTPVKLNAVIIGDENEDQVAAMVARFGPRAPQVQVRFIEYMPFTRVDHPDDGERVGPGGKAWRHVPARRLREALSARYTLNPLGRPLDGGPASLWRVEESGLVVGFISPITEHFCDACNRLRLQADGHLRTCLSKEAAPSLRDMLRGGGDDRALAREIRARVWGKIAGHEAHQLDGRAFDGDMTSIGG